MIAPGKVEDVFGCKLELVDLSLVLLPVEVVEGEIAIGFSGDLVGKTVEEECVKPTHFKNCNFKATLHIIKP